jgi:hypothetical protein
VTGDGMLGAMHSSITPGTRHVKSYAKLLLCTDSILLDGLLDAKSVLSLRLEILRTRKIKVKHGIKRVEKISNRRCT